MSQLHFQPTKYYEDNHFERFSEIEDVYDNNKVSYESRNDIFLNICIQDLYADLTKPDSEDGFQNCFDNEKIQVLATNH